VRRGGEGVLSATIRFSEKSPVANLSVILHFFRVDVRTSVALGNRGLGASDAFRTVAPARPACLHPSARSKATRG